MFTPEPMRRANIFVETSDVESVVASVARMGVFHADPGEVSEKEPWSPEVGKWEKLQKDYADQKDRLEQIMKQLKVPRLMAPSPVPARPSAPEKDTSGFLEEIETKVESARAKIKKAENEIKYLEDLIEEVRFIEPVRMPVENIPNSHALYWIMGTIPTENMENLRFALFEPAAHPEKNFRKARGKKGDAGLRKINIYMDESEVLETARALIRCKPFRPRSAESDDRGKSSHGFQEISIRIERLKERTENLLDKLGIETGSRTAPTKSYPDIEFEPIEKTLKEAENELENWRNQKSDTKEKLRQTEQLIEQTRVFEPLKISLEKIRHSKYLHFFFGTMPSKNLKNVRLELSGIPLVLIPHELENNRCLVIAVTYKSWAREMEVISDDLFSERLSLPERIRDVPGEAVGQLEKRRMELIEKIKDLERQLGKMAETWKDSLLDCHLLLRQHGEVAELIKGFRLHGDIYLASGYIPENEIDELIIHLEQVPGRKSEMEILDAKREDRGPSMEIMLFKMALVVIPVAQKGEETLVLAATARENAEVIDSAMDAVLLSPVSVPADIEGVPSEALNELEKRLRKARNRLKRLRKQRGEFPKKYGHRLIAHWRNVSANLHLLQAITQFSRHEDIFLISGWVPRARAQMLARTIEDTTGGRADVELLKVRVGGKRKPPTFLRNPTVFKPFETIVTTFGAPEYHEIDPTPLSAISFTFMYGVMFGDIGHGAMLALVGLVVLGFTGGLTKALGGVFVASGISGMVFGVLYGSIFGREDIFSGLWLSPLHDMMQLLRASVAAGVILLIVGFVMSMANLLRAGNWGELLFSHSGLAGLVLYLTAILGGLGVYHGILSLSVFLVLATAAASVLFLHEPLNRLIMGERPLFEESPGTSFARAGCEIFESLISNLGASLSFLRLGAFAVAHAAFMRVILELGQKSGELGRWPVFIFGTVLVVAFEGMVVGIQALRLEYYEFFGKFFSGGGILFRPLRMRGDTKEDIEQPTAGG